MSSKDRPTADYKHNSSLPAIRNPRSERVLSLFCSNRVMPSDERCSCEQFPTNLADYRFCRTSLQRIENTLKMHTYRNWRNKWRCCSWQLSAATKSVNDFEATSICRRRPDCVEELCDAESGHRCELIRFLSEFRRPASVRFERYIHISAQCE